MTGKFPDAFHGWPGNLFVDQHLAVIAHGLPSGRSSHVKHVGPRVAVDLTTQLLPHIEMKNPGGFTVLGEVVLESAHRLRTIEKADLESYYNSHLADFKVEEQVHARHILLKVDDNRSAEAAQSSLETARKRVEAGEDFAKLATDLSDDPGSKTRGGELGLFGRGRIIKEF